MSEPSTVVAGVSPASYFDHPLRAQELAREALSWVGTPFAPFHADKIEAGRAQLKELGIPIEDLDVKGKSGGIDCVGLVSEIFTRIGATDKWMFPREPADYQSHQSGDKILDWLRGKADDPQSKHLSRFLLTWDSEDVTDRTPKRRGISSSLETSSCCGTANCFTCLSFTMMICTL